MERWGDWSDRHISTLAAMGRKKRTQAEPDKSRQPARSPGGVTPAGISSLFASCRSSIRCVLTEQPWLDEELDFVVLAPKPPPRARTSGERVALLRSEHMMILARYDCGAMSPAIYRVVRNLEIEIAELQMRAASP